MWEALTSACFAVLVAVFLMVVNEWSKRLVFDPADRLRTAVEKVIIWIAREGQVLAHRPQDSLTPEEYKGLMSSLDVIYTELRCSNRSMVSWGWVRWMMRVPNYESISFSCMGLLILNNEASRRFDPGSPYVFGDVITKIQNRLSAIDSKNDAHQQALMYGAKKPQG